ncbi:MAG: 2-iminoacetate synthase ThiH [Fibrobacterota bacterium]
MDDFTPLDIERALSHDTLTPQDFAALLSPTAAPFLEAMAEKAHETTRRHFGNTVVLFTPLYLSNYCENTCAYCSFGAHQPIKRQQLSFDEVEAEARAIAATGLRHILLLTGESRAKAPPAYLKECVIRLKEHFSSISIEVYPLQTEEYAELVRAGVDGLTIYQETYDEKSYRALHTRGPKADYTFRLTAPERALSAGVRQVTLGPLLGLHEPVSEIYATGLHLRRLQERFPEAETALSLPRLRPLVSEFKAASPVNDRQFVQYLCACRLFAPSSGITVSTRESREFRDRILPLGVTKMSAGVSTSVGGRASDGSTGQFEISDTRSVAEMKTGLKNNGYQPILCDWHHQLTERAP